MTSGGPHSRRVLATLGLAALLAAPAVDAQLLGRLFLTPEERQALDKERYAPTPPAEAETPVPRDEPREAAPPLPPRHALRMEGLVVRSDGRNTAWVDGAAVTRPGSTAEGITVDPGSAQGGEVRISLPGVAAPVALKPGQQFDPATARVTEFRPPPAPRPERGGNEEVGDGETAAGVPETGGGTAPEDGADSPGDDGFAPDRPGEPPAAP